MSLPILVTQEKWQALEDQWRARMAELSIDEVMRALDLAGSKKRLSRCLALAQEHAKLLEAGDRQGDAARILGAALVAGGSPSELASDLMRLADEAWSEESWYAPFVKLTGLAEGAPDLRLPWKSFRKLITFQKGTLVNHPGGWGVGEVLKVDPPAAELTVRFFNGRQDVFPMHAAVEIFDPLSEEDLRAQMYRDSEGLKKRAKKEPLDVMRSILLVHNGKATTAAIRNALMQIGVEGSAWSAWWRKARKQAEVSEWFEVHGTPQKSVVHLLLEAKDPAVALKRILMRTGNLAEIQAKVREVFVGTPDPVLVVVGLEQLELRAADEMEPLQDRLAAWLLLRSERGESPEAMVPTLLEVIAAPEPTDPAEPPEIWKLFQALPTVKDQERAVDILPELFGEDWLYAVVPHLQHCANGQVRPLIDRIASAGLEAQLLEHYDGLLARPRRAPALLVQLAAMFEKGEEMEGFPTPAQRAQALLNLANHLREGRRGNPHLTRVSTKLTDVLTKGDDPLLRRLLSKADAGALRSANLTVQRGADSEIDHLVTDISLNFDRHFFAGQTGYFWESNAIWTTKRGLEKRSSELRELREVKIPENQEAIGRAASFGDLSENSEWEAAMEEQRNLTSRAMAMEEELRSADLIEEAALPEGKICPGAKVGYMETVSGEEFSIIILGPWDEDTWKGTQVVSYRAPLADGLLGHSVGAKAEVELPSGILEVKVLSIETPDLET
ncbi:MAG: GreA/GreB family elongation factor [Planctomycetota bacterium]|nr:GreA/GreB family elongation factor [Planctomycetota bacterium]